jgi:hypothetical protein
MGRWCIGHAFTTDFASTQRAPRRRNYALDTDGTFIGWGYPGASNVADRYIQEVTAGFSRTFWRHENLGSVQLGIQYAYLFLHPWVAGTGPSAANSSMVLGQVRYNLP